MDMENAAQEASRRRSHTALAGFRRRMRTARTAGPIPTGIVEAHGFDLPLLARVAPRHRPNFDSCAEFSASETIL
jgi:hypothetical protein